MFQMENPRFTVFPGNSREDAAAIAKIWNSLLKQQKVEVLAPFYWGGRLMDVGEELSIPTGDAKDLLFRGKVRLA